MANSHLEPVLLSAYLDDEVSMDERNQVERHLVTCETCQVELDGLRWTSNLLHQLPEMPLPRSFYLTEAMLEESTPPIKKSWRQWIQSLFDGLGAFPIGVGATVMALLLLMVIVQPFSATPDSQLAMVPLPTNEIPDGEVAPLAMQSEQQALMNDEGNAAAMGATENDDESSSSDIAAVAEEEVDETIREENLSVSAASAEQNENHDISGEDESDMLFETTLSPNEEVKEVEAQDDDSSVAAQAARVAPTEEIEQPSISLPPTVASTPRTNRAIATATTTTLPSASPIALAVEETPSKEPITPTEDSNIRSTKSNQFQQVTLVLIGIVLFFISCMVYWRRQAN